MPPLYVNQQGAKLRVSNGRLVVDQDGEVLLDVPLGHVSEVVLFGNVGLTTPAISQLLSENIEVAFLQEDGGYRGRLVGGLTPHVPLRRAQYRALDQPDFRLGMAHGFVSAKLNHLRALLLRHNRERNDTGITSAADAIYRFLQTVEHKTTHASLMGVEGSATAAYFSGFRRLIDPVWRFENRNRRPPADPINVLLSLGYTLITELAFAAVQTAGLDPYAGFLHEVAYNRPALALDLVEEFRPVVDGVVLWAVNSGQVTPQDFTPGPAERPVVLSDAGLHKFIKAFETRMEQRFTHPIRQQQLSMRQCIFEQGRQIASRISENRPGYTAMGFR